MVNHWQRSHLRLPTHPPTMTCDEDEDTTTFRDNYSDVNDKTRIPSSTQFSPSAHAVDISFSITESPPLMSYPTPFPPDELALFNSIISITLINCRRWLLLFVLSYSVYLFLFVT